jgi:kumamolisin
MLTTDFGKFKSVASAKANGIELSRLHGHVPAATARSTDEGSADELSAMSITVAMNPTDEAQLFNDVAAIYAPGSATYHHFLTNDEFKARYAPPGDQIQRVENYLSTQGLSQISVSDNGLLIRASGAAGRLATAFNTEIHNYKETATGKTYYAPAYELQIPNGLGVQGVHGLQNYTLRKTHLKQGEINSAAPRTGTGSGGGYAPADLRTAYNVPESGGGVGQTLAVFELDGYNVSDITTYESTFGISAVPLENVLVDNASATDSGTSAEQALDIELMLALAPKASKLMVYIGPNSDTGILDTYTKIASDNLAKSISSSWGSTETSNTSAFMQSENTVFMQMAAQGQTIFAAAGDSGADDNGSSLSVDDPSAQPYVVAVGGTKLTTTSSQAWSGETTWNQSSAAAGGGGISSIWSIPAWQTGLANSSNKGSTSMRNTPDVSLEADESTGYAIYWQGSWSVWGGTSCAAPLWAAFTGLANQQRATNGLGPLGHITPTLYAIGGSSLYNQDFHDIHDGSTNNYYSAVKGYDNATGWGSFNAANLINDLATDTAAVIGGTASGC